MKDPGDRAPRARVAAFAAVLAPVALATLGALAAFVALAALVAVAALTALAAFTAFAGVGAGLAQAPERAPGAERGPVGVVGRGAVEAVADSLPPRPLGLDLHMPVPEGNPLTPATIRLGERLFLDPLLSRDSTVSCASCHRPEHAFSDTVPLSRGIEGSPATRNTPTLLNRAWGRRFSWDGRAETLEAQVLRPIQAPGEMDLALSELERRLENDGAYASAFAGAFPEEETPVVARNVARALASYLRAQQVGGSPFDRFRAGEEDAITPEARRGARLFFGRAGCAACHSGPNFTDEDFHNTGVSWGSPDRGRQAVTGRAEDRGRFKTPTLRELTRTAPYMHDGSLATLEDVVEFYDGGAGVNPFLSSRIRALSLSSGEKGDLLAFLESLSRSR